MIICIWEIGKAGTVNKGIKNQILKKYYGDNTYDADETIMYVINQNLIWIAVNNSKDSTTSEKIDKDDRLKNIFDAYYTEMINNSNYSPYTANNVSIDKSSAKHVGNGVIGPFKIKTNDGYYRINSTGKIGSALATTHIYKDTNCSSPINEYDNYQGDVYVKIVNADVTKELTAGISISYDYCGEMLYWQTYSKGISNPQPLISFTRSANKPISESVTIEAPKGDYTLKIVKKSTDDSDPLDKYDNAISGAEFEVYQYLNLDTNLDPTEDKLTENVKVRTDKGPTTIKFKKSETIQIDSLKTDYYKIIEESAPSGYLDNGGILLLEVRKELSSDNKYVIKDVVVRAGKARAILNPNTPNAVQFTLGQQASTTKEYVSKDYVLGVYINSNNEIIVTYKNEKINEGSYNLKIIKKSENSNWNETSNDGDGALSDATYTIKQYLNVSDFDSPGALDTYLNAFAPVEKNITTTDSWEQIYDNSIKIDKFNVNLVEIYAISENQAPSGYEKSENTIYLKVKKKVKDGHYCIDYVAFLNTATGDELSPDGKYLKSEVIDGMTYLVHEGWKVKVAYKAGIEDAYIFITETDPPSPNGDYTINIEKRAMSDDSDDLSSVQAGVQFNINQYKNESTAPVRGHSKDYKNDVVTEADKETNVYFGNTNVISINNIDKYDHYEVEETEELQGFECSDLKLKFNVYKTQKDFSYVIDKVIIETANGNVELRDGTIKLDKNNKQVSNDATEYVVALTLKNNIIQIRWKDYCVGEYWIKVRKVDEEGNPMLGAKFKLAETSNQEQNLLENDGEVSSEEDKLGYTSTYTSSITKDNIENVDSYILTETYISEYYSKLKYPINIEVIKNKELYELEKMTLKVNNADKVTEINRGGSAKINDVFLENGKTVDVDISITNLGAITIQIANKPVEGKYNLNILKTDSITGETIESPVTADFTVKSYTDETFTTEATFVDEENVNLNKIYTTSTNADDYGLISIKNIVMPYVLDDDITNYIAVTEESISDDSYIKFDGTLIIPITFSRDDDGKPIYSIGEQYVIDNIINKEKQSNKINTNGSSDDGKITFSNEQNTINVTVPNSRSGVFSIRLYKQYTTKYDKTISLNDVQFAIKVTKEGETDPLYESTEENPDISGQDGENGRIQIDNLKIKEGDNLKISIREIETVDGYEIPEELKNGIEYSATAVKTKDFFGNDIIGISLDDKTYSSVRAKVYGNRRIEMYVDNEKTPNPGKYKINLAKTGEDGLVLDGVSFNRDVTLNQNNTIQDEKHNIKPNITKKQTTNNRGVICVTEEIEKDNDNFVTIPVENFIASPDVYQLTETELGNKENSYVKLNNDIILKVGKGEDEITNSTYANSITMNIGDKYVYINLKTNKYKTWTGTENDSISAVENDYESGTEQVIEISDNGLNYKVSLRGTYDTDKNEASYYIGVVNPRQPISGKYKVNIKKVGTNGTALDGIVFGRTAKLNVDQTTGTAEKTVSTDMEATSNGGYASVTKDVETSGSEIITVSKDNYTKSDTYKINEKSLGTYDNTYSKYPYDINLVVEKKYKNYTAGVDKAILTINNETKEIDLSDIAEQKITVTDENGEDLDVIMNATKENNEVTITLTIENSEIISVPVEKRWVDGNDENKIRPTSINVELKYKKDGNWVKYEKDGVENPVTLNEANSWKYTWENLPKNINGSTAEYTVEESVVPYGYTVNKTTEKGVIILTNTHEVTNIVAKSKQWKNVTNANLYRVDMELYKKGETTKIGDTKSVIGNDMATWRNLEKYDRNGNEIEYVVKETKAYYRTDENSEEWIELEEGKDYVADEENGVFINTWVTPGKYKIMLSKIEKDSKKAISGVTFKVNEILTDATGTNGITYVKDKNGNQLEVNIDIDNYNVTDTYEITEINLNNKENEYYKIKDSLKVNVTKARLTDNDQITYKLDSVSFEGGTVGSDGVARKEVTLENDEKAEVTAEIIGSTVKITIPNKEKSGKYSLKLIKYKKGTQTAVAGTKFHLIGGNVGNIQFEQNNKPLSETNYKEIVTETTPVIIWQDSINIRDIATPDTYTLKEADVGENNTDMFIGFTESIKITVNKNNNYNVESIGLTVDGKEATEQNGKLVFSKTIDNQTITATLSLDKSTNTITLEVENPEKHGSFDFNLVKYIKGTETPLDGAGFKIKIVNKENNEVLKDGEGNSIDGTKEIFVENGKILIENINIAKAGITYEVTIEETTVPDGYIGLDGPITFTAVSEANADGKTYSLKTNKSTTIANAKLVEVKEDEILIEAENRVKPTIHKGVKDVKNQSSGYYNEITGDTYENIEDAKKATLPEWVIDTTLPQGVEEYKIYEISDTIDERLTYEGIASVKIIDGENIVANLVEKTDYKVSYDKETRLLKITFIGENQALSETLKQNIGKTIEVRFNTKFALDANGNIIALNQSVPNQATLTYGNGSTVNSEKPEIHTGGVGLFKYDKKTGKALSGAHFKIATSKENAENKVFLKDTEGNDVEAISGEDGVAEFTGLEFGEDALNKVEYKVNDEITGAEVYKYDWEKVQTTYYIVETESPEGYMLLEEPIEAIVKKDNYNIEDITSLIQVGNQSNKFDLKLRKWVTQAIVIENGKTVYTETGHKAEDEPEEVVKVDLRRSKLEDVVVKFKYSIRVTNEGEIAGEATEIRDDKPDGLIFVQDDNPDWRYENGDIITDKLAGTTLQPGESAEVEILLTWDNSEDNMGTMINRAEIQKDHNDYGVPDIDSTPGNRVPGEDDIDDAPVMITVKTGTDYIIYSSILLGAIAIIISGGVVIKKKVMKRI